MSTRTLGRPPKADAMTAAQRQVVYRSRLKAAGKAVRTVSLDAVADRALDVEERERFRRVLLRVGILEEDRARLDRRVADLEAELRRVDGAYGAALKEIVMLKAALRR